MTREEFLASLHGSAPPKTLPPLLLALWWEAKGDWDRAHDLAQSQDEGENRKEAAWVHAYLHRKEGDRQNAAYWYRNAGQPIPKSAHEEEWQEIVRELLYRLSIISP